MLRYKYTLTKSGERRCIKSEFYLQDTPTYKGYTEKIFRSLHISQKPLTVRQISEMTGIRTRSVNGVITFNIYAGYIRRIFLWPDKLFIIYSKPLMLNSREGRIKFYSWISQHYSGCNVWDWTTPNDISHAWTKHRSANGGNFRYFIWIWRNTSCSYASTAWDLAFGRRRDNTAVHDSATNTTSCEQRKKKRDICQFELCSTYRSFAQK